MSTVTALMEYLQAHGLGTAGTTLFGATSAAVPAGAGPFTHLIEYGGAVPVESHDDHGTSIDRPRVQVTVHAASALGADLQAQACHRALSQIVNVTTLDGVRYLRVVPVQAPFDMGLDTSGRARVAFNVECWKVVE